MKATEDFKSRYSVLYTSAVQAIESYDLTEDSYNNIISILEKMEKLLIQEGSEKKSSEEQRIVDQYFSDPDQDKPLAINGMLDRLIQRDGALRQKGFFPIHQSIHAGIFLPPIQGNAPQTGSGNGFEAPRFLDKKTPLLLALAKIEGLYQEDVRILESTKPLPSSMMRDEPYVIIDIPRLNVQIAVCNQYGEAVYVAKPALTINQWCNNTKDDLQDQGLATQVKWDNQSKWINRIIHLITHDNKDQSIDVSQTKKIPLPRRPVFWAIEDTIVQWMEWYNDKQKEEKRDTGEEETKIKDKYPSRYKDGPVYIKNNKGEWVESGFTWKQVCNYIRGGAKFEDISSLADLKEKHFGKRQGLPDRPSEETIVQWMEWHKERQGQYPSEHSDTVYLKNNEGEWVDSEFTWQQVNGYVRNTAKFDGISSLADLKEKHFRIRRGLPSGTSEQQIVQWMEWYNEKQKQEKRDIGQEETKIKDKYPNKHSGTVYLKDDSGKWIESDFTWQQVCNYIGGRAKFEGISSLADLKRKHVEFLTMSGNPEMIGGRGDRVRG
jgi:hypothetical protein